MSASLDRTAGIREQLKSYTPADESPVDLSEIAAPAGMRGADAVRGQLRVDMLAPRHDEPISIAKPGAGTVLDLENPRGY